MRFQICQNHSAQVEVMANSKSTTKNSFDLGISVTEAVLKAYDNGTTTPPAILATLMFSFPTLTLATVKSILQTHRKSKSKQEKRKKPQRPKTPAEQLEDSIKTKCYSCGYHQASRPCVMPMDLCPYPEMDSDMKRLEQMRVEERSRRGVIKVKGGHITYTKRPRFGNAFEEVEQELDEISGENAAREWVHENPFVGSGPIESTLDDAMFFPEGDEEIESVPSPVYTPDLPEELQKPEDEWTMEDFSDVLSPTLLDTDKIIDD